MTHNPKIKEWAELENSINPDIKYTLIEDMEKELNKINILKDIYYNTWNKIKSLEKSLNLSLINVENTRNGDKTLWIEKEGKKIYIHSRYNPIREAETLIEEYGDIEDNTTVVFYGIGLGYHIDLFLKKYPNVNYYIYEPVPEMLYAYLSNKSLKDLPNKNLMDIVLGNDRETTTNFLNNVIKRTEKNTILVELPVHKQVFPEEYQEFSILFKDMIKDKRRNLKIDFAFQERWILNSMINFKEVLNTPNILLEKKGMFKGKPVILVAAGPSLNEEIENVRHIKENGLAYIFSVGSAINTLIHHDIYPHAACTYDPTVNNQKVFAKVKEKGIKDIPMIFGSSVGYETLIGYPGNKYHMITSQDTVSNYYLKNEDGSTISIVQDAPSIAVVTLQLLYEMGFNPVILVGQNLAYRGKERHSEGVYYSSEVTEEEMKKGIWVKDVYGNEVLTNEGFNSMRQQMEMYIKAFPNIKVINTTKCGVHIEGTSFMELREVIDEYLKEKVVEENWMKGNKTQYDKEYLKNQSENMDRAYKRAFRLMDEYHDILDKIEKMIEKGKFNSAEKMYIELDKALRKIEHNDFFKVFILPMNRVQYKHLADSIDSLNEIKDPFEKGRRIVESFRNFVDLFKKCIDKIETIYQEMSTNIKNF